MDYSKSTSTSTNTSDNEVDQDLAMTWDIADKCRDNLASLDEPSTISSPVESSSSCSLVRGASPADVRRANARTSVRNLAFLKQDSEAKLRPLRHVCNGRVVSGFPETFLELYILDDAKLDHILRCLGAKEWSNFAVFIKVQWIASRWLSL